MPFTASDLKSRANPEASTLDKVLGFVERNTEKDTTIGNILNALDKPQSSVTALLGQALKADASGIPSQSEIWSGEKQYYPSQLLDIDNPVGAFALDALADPLNLIGVGPLAKGATAGVKAGKAGAKLAKVANAYDKLGKTSKLAVKLATAGAGVGALAADSPEELPSSILKHASGLGLVAPLIGGAQELGKVGSSAVDYIAKGAKPEVFKGSNLAFSEATDIVKGTANKYDEISRGIIKRDSDLGLYDLSEADYKNLASVSDEAFADTMAIRNDLIGDRLKFRLDVNDVDKSIDGLDGTYQAKRYGSQKFGDRIAIHDAGDGTYRKLVATDGADKFVPIDKKYNSIDEALSGHTQPAKVKSFNSNDSVSRGVVNSGGEASTVIDQVELNKFTDRANTHVGRIVNRKLAELNNPRLTDAVANFTNRNRAIMEDYNSAMKARHGSDYIPTTPIDFHTLEVRPLESLEDVYKKGSTNLREGLVKRTTEKVETGGLNFKERLQLEAERFPINYMEKTEKEARRIVNGVKYSKLDAEHPLKFIEKSIDKWDEFTNFLKQQQLTFSHSWIVNNATENLTRAYMQNGLTGLMKSADSLTNKKMWNNLLSITDPNQAFRKGTQINDTLFQSALNSGAISEGFFGEAFRKGHMSKPMLMAKIGNKEATRMFDDIANLSQPKKLYKSYQDMLSNTVGRTGQIVENSARMATYSDTINKIIGSKDELAKLGIAMSPKKIKELLTKGDYYKNIKAHPELKKITDLATKVVNDTFFDYSNVSTFEQSVMKRLFPYWTFFSNNTKYWADQIANNPDAVKRLATAYTAIGSAPDKKQREGIPDYLLERGARISRDGKILSAPNISFFDFFNTLPTNIGESGLEKAHPIIGLAKNLLTNTDDFGNPLLPSTTKTGRKRVYSGGLKLEPLTSSIFRDKSGKKAYTDSDTVALVNELQSALLPIPAIDTAIRVADETINKETPLSDTLLNLISPIKTKNIDKKDFNRARRMRRSNAKRLKRNIKQNERLKN